MLVPKFYKIESADKNYSEYFDERLQIEGINGQFKRCVKLLENVDENSLYDLTALCNALEGIVSKNQVLECFVKETRMELFLNDKFAFLYNLGCCLVRMALCKNKTDSDPE